MKLVIDIPEEMYKRLAKAPRIATFEECVKDRKMFVTAIQNGTPLPKGYGRLIYADDVYDALGPYVSFSDLYDALNEIPTIVEADKEE